MKTLIIVGLFSQLRFLLFVLSLVVRTCASDCLKRLISKVIMCYAGRKTLLTHSLTFISEIAAY